MAEGLIDFVRRKNGAKIAKSIIDKKKTEDPIVLNVEYCMFIDDYGMTPEEYLRSEKHEN